MLLNSLLLNSKNKLDSILNDYSIPYFSADIPQIILFFVLSDGSERAQITIETGDEWQQTWDKGVVELKKWCVDKQFQPIWLRVEVVRKIEKLSWLQLKSKLKNTKRNYFRFGLSFSNDFKTSLLEYELYANAILYTGDEGVATPNAVNLKSYGKKRFKRKLDWPADDDTVIYRFKTHAVFSDEEDTYHIESEGRNSGYRKISNWDANTVTDIIETSSQYLGKQVKKDGSYHYGWFPCFDRAIPTYNALRHASSTYALLEGWEVTQQPDEKEAIKRALEYLESTLIKQVILPDGSKASFLVDLGNEIKLGGNAVSILAYAKYTELTGDRKYLALMEQLAIGIIYMQNSITGKYVHVLNYPDLSVKADMRTIYYDGEAAFGLMRLYGITKDPRWIASVEHAFDYFIENKHWRAHDHWLSYCVNELTLYKADPKYYKFGLDNVRDHLDFVLTRITTFPTLLELMMAAQRMIERIKKDSNVSYLLDDFEIDKFYHALEYRARYLLNGFFYPEIAMFFKNPQRILGSFFIRHHTFRVRIDDVEHYLSGYVAYRKYLLNKRAKLSENVSGEKKLSMLLQSEYLEQVLGGKWILKPDINWKATGICISPLMYKFGHILIARGSDNRGFLSVDNIKKFINRGGSGIICEDPTPFLAFNIPILQVRSIRKAILDLGKEARTLFHGDVIGVTGSAGKTTTVSMVAHALSIFEKTGHTQNSANLPLGISWNQINMPIDAKHWVVEMAIGQMPVNSLIANPKIAIITNIGPAHLEYHIDTKTIAEKKACIMNEMKPGQVLILFGEIIHKDIFLKKAKEKSLLILTFGEGKDNDFQLLSLIRSCMHFRIFDTHVTLQINLPNKYLAFNILSTFAVVYALNLDWKRLLSKFSSFSLPDGRGKPYPVAAKDKSFILYDDTYNANPLSMKSAIASLAGVKNKNKCFLILGDMKELGKDEITYHRQLKDEIDKLKPEKLILCGDLMHYLWLDIVNDNTYDQVKRLWVGSVDKIIEILDDWIEEGDQVVLKASNSMRFKRIVEHFN